MNLFAAATEATLRAVGVLASRLFRLQDSRFYSYSNLTGRLQPSRSPQAEPLHRARRIISSHDAIQRSSLPIGS